jgi:IrrE N-terminal-like domain
MLVLHHQGRPVAYVAAGAARLAPHVLALESDHPTRRWVDCLVVFARDVAQGLLPVPFTPAAAEYFARCVLMPDDEFLAECAYPDAALAEMFNVPLEQIARKRRDLLLMEGLLFDSR